jgi:hypothetical protein
MMSDDEVNEHAMIMQYMNTFMGGYSGAIMVGYSWHEFAKRHKREMELKWLERLYEKEESANKQGKVICEFYSSSCEIDLPWYL